MASSPDGQPRWRRRLARHAPLVLAAILPAALLGAGVARFIINDFFVHAPYLLDAGWYSKLVWHAGISPRNPVIACDYAEWYFGVHPSAYISLWSGLSYLTPLPRIEWYALFQAFVFAPFGFATYLVSSRMEPAGLTRRLPFVMLVAFAFTFHGQVLRMIDYPHYEGAIAAFGGLLLGAIVTGRPRLAWFFLVLTISVREDAGLHTALALSPLLYLQWRGVELPASRRTLLAMCGVAIAASVAGIICQKLLSNGFSTLRAVYLGDPIYGHVNAGMLVERGKAFLRACPAIYYPFLATCVLAVLRRDARYLLGWAAGAPWFVLNFLASQPQKAVFESYAHFPYIVALLWVFAYGAMLAPAPRRLRPRLLEAVFALMCISSTLGLYQANASATTAIVHDMAVLGHVHRGTMHRFVDDLARHHDQLGHLYVDYSVAAIALESVGQDQLVAPDVEDADTIAFHGGTTSRDQILPVLFANHLDACTRIRGTEIYVCARTPFPAQVFEGIRTDIVPSSFTFANSLLRPGVRVTDRGIRYANGVGIDGWLGQLPKGTYDLRWTIDTELPPGSAPMVSVNIMVGAESRTSVTVPTGNRTVSLEFQAGGDEVLWFRSQSLVPGAFTVTDAQIVHVR